MLELRRVTASISVAGIRAQTGSKKKFFPQMLFLQCKWLVKICSRALGLCNDPERIRGLKD